MDAHPEMRIRSLGLQAYESTWQAMRQFTEERQPHTPDEIWQLEHPPVFTLGISGREEHILDAGPVPVVQSDRGGQVTYHGPGQVVLYVLLDLKRHQWGARRLVTALEQCVIAYLTELGVSAEARRDAPGVYVDGAKIAALGLRVRRGGSYHGLAFNVNPDLSAFQRINPCGYAGMEVCSLASLGIEQSFQQAADALTRTFLAEWARPSQVALNP